MTGDELQSALDRLRREASDRARQVIEHDPGEAIDDRSRRPRKRGEIVPFARLRPGRAQRRRAMRCATEVAHCLMEGVHRAGDPLVTPRQPGPHPRHPVPQQRRGRRPLLEQICARENVRKCDERLLHGVFGSFSGCTVQRYLAEGLP